MNVDELAKDVYDAVERLAKVDPEFAKSLVNERNMPYQVSKLISPMEDKQVELDQAAYETAEHLEQ